MKKRLITCLLICMMAFSFVIPVIATEVAPSETVDVVGEQGIMPLNEQTRIYFRVTSEGILQFRVWSITNGRWITEWLYF